MKIRVLFLLSVLSISIASAALVSNPKIVRSRDAVEDSWQLDGSRRLLHARDAVPPRSEVDSRDLQLPAETIPGSAVSGNAATGPPDVAVATALPPFKLSGGGPVALFGVSPDGLTVVWIEAVAGIDELFSRPVDGSGPAVPLTAGVFISGDAGVSGFDFSPDGSTVVFTGDFVSSSGTDSLASVATGGGAVVTLNNPGADEPVTDFGISPDGLLVFYLGTDTLHGSDRTEVYTNSISGGVPIQLSGAGLSGHGLADVSFAAFTPDSASVIHAADITANGVLDLFAGPATGYFTATLSSALGTATWAQIGPTRVSYIADDDILGVQEVYSVLIDGSGKLKLNSSAPGSATDLEVSSDGARVLYLADQDLPGVIEGHTARVDTAASSMKIHSDLLPSRDTDSVNFTPDSASVVYRADELEDGVIEIFSRPIDLSAPSMLLHDVALGETVGIFEGRGVPILNRRAIYPVFGATVDLFTVPTDGSEAHVRLNAPLDAGRALFSGFVPLIQTARLMAYGGGSTAIGITDKIYSAPIRTDLPVEQINLTAGTGDIGVGNYLINATETHGVYSQDQDTQGTLELYSAELDSDADGVGNATDTCRFVSNPGETPVPFQQTIIVPERTKFVWSDRAEVRFAQGPIPLDGTYMTTNNGTLLDADSFEDLSTPTSGSGTWTLIAPDCPGRDWGTAGRNLALP